MSDAFLLPAVLPNEDSESFIKVAVTTYVANNDITTINLPCSPFLCIVYAVYYISGNYVRYCGMVTPGGDITGGNGEVTTTNRGLAAYPYSFGNIINGSTLVITGNSGSLIGTSGCTYTVYSLYI